MSYFAYVNTRWNLRPTPDPEVVESLAQSLGIDALSASVFVIRGLKDFEAVKAFCTPLDQPRPDPRLMADMDRATERVLKAIAEQETVMIYGDYDVDGTTAVALMYQFLRPHLSVLHCYIPDRYTEGYGISEQGIRQAAEWGCRLMIALDCGIKSIDKVELANSLGIDCIICDHHQPGALLPAATAVLDPMRPDCAYPYKGLSGCGVGFKLAEALTQALGLDPATLEPLTDLVAVSIGSDIVPMTGENRILAALGLKVLNERPRPGFKALMKSAGGGVYGVDEVVFRIGPRINAAGRMRHGMHAVALLSASTDEEANALAEAVETDNHDRKRADDQTRQEALEQLKGTELRCTSVVFAPHWKKGVIGIVAARLIEQWYRPTVVFTGDGTVLSGSARSVAGFDLYSAIDACSAHLIQFGGHAFAAGMTVAADRLDDFRSAFERVVSERLRPEHLQPTLDIELELPLEALKLSYVGLLRRLAPFGPQNPKPVFCTRNVTVSTHRRLGADQSHLKMGLALPGGGLIDAIYFKRAEKALPYVQSNPVDLAYHVEVNEWQGRQSVQLMVLDLKPSANAADQSSSEALTGRYAQSS